MIPTKILSLGSWRFPVVVPGVFPISEGALKISFSENIFITRAFKKGGNHPLPLLWFNAGDLRKNRFSLYVHITREAWFQSNF